MLNKCNEYRNFATLCFTQKETSTTASETPDSMTETADTVNGDGANDNYNPYKERPSNSASEVA